MNWLLFWLVLHILAAILAFGPTYTFPIIAAMARQAPQHIPFALRVQERIATRMVVPLGLSMAVSGVGLLFAAGIDLPKTPYLLVAIGLYLIGMAIGLFVLVPNGAKLIHMVDQMTGASAPATPGPGAAPAAPPAAFMALVRRQQVFGAINGLLVFVIVFLMVVKPGGIVGGPLFG